MPGVDVALANLMGLNPSVKRMMFYFVGCASSITLLRAAKDVAENNEGSRILVVCGDIVSVSSFRGPSEKDLSNLVAQSFLSDGIAALIVGADPEAAAERPLYEIQTIDSYLMLDTQKDGFGRITQAGMMISLSREFPDKVASCVQKVLKESDALKRALQVEEVSGSVYNELFWATHTGGRKTLDELEKRLELKPEKLQATRETLAEYGNMGAASVFHLLDRIRRQSGPKPAKGGLLVGYGPGISVEVAYLKTCAPWA